MSEFDFIEECFAPLAGQGARGLLDDAAVLDIPARMQLVMSSDTSNRGDHFVDEMPVFDAARKCLRSNLSDLAAMGADPFCYQLNLALPKGLEESWGREFAKGLAADQEEFGIYLSGGDTTGMAAGGLSISITALGLVPKGTAVARGGARSGDLVVVTGVLGDAFLSRLHIPTPRTAIASLVRAHAHAAVDISDGILADLGHICEVSKLGARIELEKIPFSGKGRAALTSGSSSAEDLLTWGEDYELALAVPPSEIAAFEEGAKALGVSLSVVGAFDEKESGVVILGSDGAPLEFTKTGWVHF